MVALDIKSISDRVIRNKQRGIAMNIQQVLENHKIYIKSFGRKGEKANLYGANLRGANLRGADLRGADMYGADMYGANLRGANLRGADLRGADMYGADMYGADMYGANLRDANLRGADLRGANLRGADLRDANLYGANLYGADLRDADLRGANLRDANLRDADLPESTFIIIGERYFISIANGDCVRAGCQSHSVDAWRKFSKQEVAEMDGKSALRFYPRLLDIVDFYLGKGERPDWVNDMNKEEE